MRTARCIAGGVLCVGMVAWAVAGSAGGGARASYFEIQVIDRQTRRGVPLVELETVDHVRFVTDNAGRVAFGEPGLLGKNVHFSVRSHGYEFPKDGFGFAGVALETQPGRTGIVELTRLNLAERLYRITGAGLYRDTILLGHRAPLAQPLLNGGVVGQDSAQAVVRDSKAWWFWGDTSRAGYPLGNFRTSGATCRLPGAGGLEPGLGLDLEYFTTNEGFVRGMCPFEPSEGAVWIDGLGLAADREGQLRMVARFARMKSLGEMLEQGLVVFDDGHAAFVRLASVGLAEAWRFPQGQSTATGPAADGWLYYCTPFPSVRVRASLAAMQAADSYEAWTCLEEGSSVESLASAQVRRTAAGDAVWRWTGKAPPLNPRDAELLVKAGRLRRDEAMVLPVDAESGKPVRLHGGSVRWNAHRQRYVLVGVEEGGSSFLGEVWYGEARELTGPWVRVRKIVTHDRYSFYNPVHHAFLDQGGGRFIHFEGTYCKEFSGNPEPTPRYDYNQVMYRLDVDDPRLAGVRN